jgi:hypothetical protein
MKFDALKFYLTACKGRGVREAYTTWRLWRQELKNRKEWELWLNFDSQEDK